MALKADRNELDVDISFFYNEGTAEKGQVVVLDTVGSGAAMDQAQSKVKIAAATNALFPVGILLNDVVNQCVVKRDGQLVISGKDIQDIVKRFYQVEKLVHRNYHYHPKDIFAAMMLVEPLAEEHLDQADIVKAYMLSILFLPQT